jgi:tartrate-resistant acid phosphatase type 5
MSLFQRVVILGLVLQSLFAFAGGGGRLTWTERNGASFFYPDLKDRDRVSFLIIGDMGTASSAQMKVGRAMADVCRYRDCDFAIGLGDNIYNIGAQNAADRKFITHFEDAYVGLGGLPFWMSLGNHDALGNVDAQVEYTVLSHRWRMPAEQYMIPGLPKWAHFIALHSTQMPAGRALWVQRQICESEGWKFIYGHHPVYSNGKHGDNLNIESLMLPTIRQCGVDVYFSGHDHHQEHIVTPWFHQIIQGAGAKLRPVKTAPSRLGGTVVQRFATSTYGFGWAELTRDEMSVEFFDDNAAVIYSTVIYPRTQSRTANR